MINKILKFYDYRQDLHRSHYNGYFVYLCNFLFKVNLSRRGEFRVKKIIFKALKVVLLALFLMAAIVPLYWVIVTSLKGNKEIYSYPIKYFPESPTLENYVYLFEVSNFGVYFRNSALVALVGSMGALLISTFSGYAISRLRKKRTKLLLILAMYFTQMIPTYMVMVPLFTMFASIGKTDNLLSLSLVYINMMIAFSTIMGKSFFDRIPVAWKKQL